MADTRLVRNESLRFRTTSASYTVVLKFENEKLDAPQPDTDLPTTRRGVYKLVVTDRGGQQHEVVLEGVKASPPAASRKRLGRVAMTYEVF